MRLLAQLVGVVLLVGFVGRLAAFRRCTGSSTSARQDGRACKCRCGRPSDAAKESRRGLLTEELDPIVAGPRAVRAHRKGTQRDRPRG